MLIDEAQLINWSTAVGDTMMDCQVRYAELSVNHRVTRRPSRSVLILYISAEVSDMTRIDGSTDERTNRRMEK